MKGIAILLAFLSVSAIVCGAQDEAGAATDVITCGVGHDGQTAPLRSSAGFTAVLKMQGDDDHGKNTHLCAAEYTLRITDPDGSSKPLIKLLYSDDDWGRPIVFRVEGFSSDGKHVFTFISEGSHPEYLAVGEYNMSSALKVREIFLD